MSALVDTHEHAGLPLVVRTSVNDDGQPIMPLLANRVRDVPTVASAQDLDTKHLTCMPCILPGMSTTGDLKVSSRGQMSLPASTRHRWGLDEGGELGYLDVGDAIVLVPGGVDRLRAALLDVVSDADWDAARSGFGDPELANE